jgi:hypothetical protein
MLVNGRGEGRMRYTVVQREAVQTQCLCVDNVLAYMCLGDATHHVVGDATSISAFAVVFFFFFLLTLAW